MKLRSVIFVVLSVAGFLTAYLLYEPVPDGITEPGKYRAFMAGFRLVRLLVSVAHLAHREEPFETYYIKSLRHIQNRITPTPKSEVEGSYIRSRSTLFNGVPVRVYEPMIRKENAAKLPGFVYIHGGGMCVGSADSYDKITRKMAEDLNAVLISIDYRLAPEHPFPSGFEDCLTATRHFMHHAEELGVDPKRIGVGGDSAGGHLSASVAQAIHDDSDLPDLKVQVLIYPSVQKIDLNTPSYQKYAAEFGDAGILPASLVATFLTLLSFGRYDPYIASQIVKNNHTSSKFKKQSVEYTYVNHEQIPVEFRDPRYYKTRNDLESGDSELWERISHHFLDARDAPLFRRDLSGLPPALIMTMGFDPLRDDGIFYKNRLENAGNSVQLVHYEAGFHGLFSLQEFDLAVTMFDDILAYLRKNI